jgi:hypothetical protein
MAKVTDLYSILRAYAHKNNSPFVKIDVFLEFLEKYALFMAKEQPEWIQWTRDVGAKFWNELPEYTKNGKCVLMTDAPEGPVYMAYFLVEKLRELYKSVDKAADLPFPGEDSLKITLPEDQIKVLELRINLTPYFEKPAESFLPVIKLLFPDDLGSALILAPMIPRQLVEAALFKVQYYLQQHNNREYAQHKLIPRMPGKDQRLRDTLDQILNNPLDALPEIETCGDFSYNLWNHFCFLIKTDIQKKNEKLPGDIAVAQAACIIETCCQLYRSRIQKSRVRETAFYQLELCMDKPPFYFSMEAITQFINHKGKPLLGQYSAEELENYIRQRTSESQNNEVPEWLLFQGKNDERWFLKKYQLLPLLARMIPEARTHVQKAVIGRWIKMIREFQSEPAMENDPDFEKLLAVCTYSCLPLLSVFLEDDKLFWVYDEFERTHGTIPLESRVFEREKLLPLSSLFQIKRRDALLGAKVALPFWYSFPLFTAIAAFFANWGKKQRKPQRKNNGELAGERSDDGDGNKSNPAQDLIKTAKTIESALVPQGQTLKGYLGELEDRWNKNLDEQVRKNLLEDVNALVRDNLRHALRLRKNRITRQALGETAAVIIAGTPSLRDLNEKDALQLYMELYMIKQLLTVKF